MTKPKYQILTGDVRAVCQQMPEKSVHCVVTSPPYWGQRDYKVGGQFGLERTPEEYVANQVAVPFVTDVNHGYSGDSNGRTQSVDGPLGTVTTKRGKAMVTPYVLPRQGFYDHQTLKRCRGIDEPLPTITASHIPAAVVMPFQYQLIGRGAGKSRSIESPVPTVIAARENHGIVLPWLSGYYGNATQSEVSGPVPTITTKDRHALCAAICRGPEDWPAAETDAMRLLQATMRALGVSDIGFRMLSNPELGLAQGFPADYIFHGTKSEVTKQIGNSVSPDVAEALTLGVLSA